MSGSFYIVIPTYVGTRDFPASILVESLGPGFRRDDENWWFPPG